MKTTLDLPDALVKQVKLRAVREGRKLKDAVADLLAAKVWPLPRIQTGEIVAGNHQGQENGIAPDRVQTGRGSARGNDPRCVADILLCKKWNGTMPLADSNIWSWRGAF